MERSHIGCCSEHSQMYYSTKIVAEEDKYALDGCYVCWAHKMYAAKVYEGLQKVITEICKEYIYKREQSQVVPLWQIQELGEILSMQIIDFFAKVGEEQDAK